MIGNNIANVNTTGYKSARLNFADTFGEAMVSGSGGNVASQFGNGVVSAGVTTSYAGGGITETGHGSDLAIENGKGFFIVKNAANEESFATRAGNFREDNQGYLVNSQGYRVQGALGDGNGGEGDLLFLSLIHI